MKALATIALIGLAYGSEDNQLFKTDNLIHQVKNRTTFRPQNTGIVPPHLLKDKHQLPKNASTGLPPSQIQYQTNTRRISPKNHTQISKRAETFADDDELFLSDRRNVTTRSIPLSRLRNNTHTPHPKGTHNRTRPFLPSRHTSHNRTVTKKLITYEDEDLFVDEDDELYFWDKAPVRTPNKPPSFHPTHFSDENDELYFWNKAPVQANFRPPVRFSEEDDEFLFWNKKPVPLNYKPNTELIKKKEEFEQGYSLLWRATARPAVL